jgi:succinate dehydrogenase flavin-adding protein (antitoxin of CptAB toxin-antitoxin module)
LTRLLELEDHDLWALVSNKRTTDDVELAAMIKRLQKI